jgi:hypothetical protein
MKADAWRVSAFPALLSSLIAIGVKNLASCTRQPVQEPFSISQIFLRHSKNTQTSYSSLAKKGYANRSIGDGLTELHPSTETRMRTREANLKASPHRLTSPITIQRPSQITPRILNFVTSGHRQVIQGNKIHTYITHISSRLPHPPSLRSENQSTITSQLRHHGSVGLQRIAGD